MSNDLAEGLLSDLATRAAERYWGKYRGIVRDVDDPEGLGRLTAEVPSVLGDEVSPWALPAVPFAGSGHGLVLLPEPGDGVWIEFEAGDVARPIWSGVWWARGELPSPAAKQVRALITTAGLQLVLDDDAKKIRLVHPGGAEISLTDSEIRLAIGSATLVLSASGVSINDGAFEVR